MSDGMAKAESEKYCHEAQVAEVMNGFVVKVGCKTFVADAKELDGLLTYFTKKEVPAKLKKLVGGGAFLGLYAAEECPEGGCCQAGPGVPSFVRDRWNAKVLKVVNGWVVSRDDQSYIAKTKEQLVKLVAEDAPLHNEGETTGETGPTGPQG